jgi:hypothetical protein
MIKLFLALWLVSFAGLFANSQISDFTDPDIPSIEINENTKLSLLNGRLGSRFSLSYSGTLHGFYSGALGFEAEDVMEFLLGIEVNGKMYCFRTSNLPNGAEYFDNQKLILSMTGMHFSGETPNGLNVRLSIISPFTPSENLGDSENIKIQIVPAFFILAEVTNNSGKDEQISIKTGINRIPAESENYTNLRGFSNGKKGNQLLYRDSSGPTTLLGLKSTDTNALYFEKQTFSGLQNRFNVNDGGSAKSTFIYAAHHSGKVLSDNKLNMPLRFYYTNFWKNIEEVFQYCEENTDQLLAKSAKFENILKTSGTSPEEKWTTALTFRSDLANTFFLLDKKDKPRFYVMEGRFRHLSTIDVAYETELNAIFSPWRLKLQLDQWTKYMATKEVNRGEQKIGDRLVQVTEGMSAAEFGPYLYHDVGDFPFISETSDYVFGPFMAVEENTSFTLLLYWYWKLTGDNRFVSQQLGTLDLLLQSLINRDSNGNGIADKAMGWSTYDVSQTLKTAPENVYLGVKQLNAYIVAAEMLTVLSSAHEAENTSPQSKEPETTDGEGVGHNHTAEWDNSYLRKQQASKYLTEADKILKSLEKANRKIGYVPLSLDENVEGWNQYSVVLGEGLLYPGLCGNQSEIVIDLAKLLKPSYLKAFELLKTDYGIRLTSDEPVTWFSKIMVSDYVASYWFSQQNTTAHYTYEWNKNNRFAYNDGAFSNTKSWPGNWYPRGISALLYILNDQNFKAENLNSFLNNYR